MIVLALVAAVSFAAGVLCHALIVASTTRAVTQEQRRAIRSARHQHRPREALRSTFVADLAAEEQQEREENREGMIAAYQAIQEERG